MRLEGFKVVTIPPIFFSWFMLYNCLNVGIWILLCHTTDRGNFSGITYNETSDLDISSIEPILGFGQIKDRETRG